MKTLINTKRVDSSTFVLLFVFILGVIWEIIVFIKFPQQAWVGGLLDSWFVSKGLSFYKDFIGGYTPFLHILMLPLHQLFGFKQEVTIVLSPITSLITMSLILVASLKLLKKWFRIIPIVFFVVWDPYLNENHFTTSAFLGLITSVIFVLWIFWIKNYNKILVFFVGLACGIGIFTMQILTPFVVIIFISILLQSINKKDFNQLTLACFGVLIVALPILIWLFKDEIFNYFYYWTIQYQFTAYPRASFGKSLNDVLVFLGIHTPIIFLLVTLIRCMKDKKFDQESFFILMFVLLLLALTVPIWFAIFHPSRFQMSLPLLALALGFGVMKLSTYKNSLRPIIFVILTIFILLNSLAFNHSVLPRYIKNFNYPQDKKVLTKLYVDDPMYEAVKWVKNNTPFDAKIYVIGDALFYFESQRIPANFRGNTHSPVVYEPFDAFVSEIKSKPPDYWVIDERQWRRFDEFGYGWMVPLFEELLACQKVEAHFDYWTVRKQSGVDNTCLIKNN